jgi:hypothetical protein
MPIKDMVDSMKKMEKSGLSAWGNYTFEGDNPTQTLAGGMLEKI